MDLSRFDLSDLVGNHDEKFSRDRCSGNVEKKCKCVKLFYITCTPPDYCISPRDITPPTLFTVINLCKFGACELDLSRFDLSDLVGNPDEKFSRDRCSGNVEKKCKCVKLFYITCIPPDYCISPRDITPPTLFTVIIQSFLTDRSGQTVQTQIRLLLEEQSDQGLHCLLFNLHLFDEIP